MKSGNDEVLTQNQIDRILKGRKEWIQTYKNWTNSDIKENSIDNFINRKSEQKERMIKANLEFYPTLYDFIFCVIHS